MPLDAGDVKIIAKKGDRNPTALSSGDKSQITVVAYASALGSVMPPMVILDRKTLPPQFTEGEIPGTTYGLSAKGWIDQELFDGWFATHFLKHAPLSRPLLLLLDGHSSHYCPDTVRLAAKEKVIIFALPPNTTHITQPLDKGCFGPLKSYWKQECHNYMSESGRVVNRYVFSRLLSKAWMNAMTIRNVMGGFKVSGIYPFNRNAVQHCLVEKPKEMETLAKKSGLAYIPLFSLSYRRHRSPCHCRCSSSRRRHRFSSLQHRGSSSRYPHSSHGHAAYCDHDSFSSLQGDSFSSSESQCSFSQCGYTAASKHRRSSSVQLVHSSRCRSPSTRRGSHSTCRHCLSPIQHSHRSFRGCHSTPQHGHHSTHLPHCSSPQYGHISRQRLRTSSHHQQSKSRTHCYSSSQQNLSSPDHFSSPRLHPPVVSFRNSRQSVSCPKYHSTQRSDLQMLGAHSGSMSSLLHMSTPVKDKESSKTQTTEKSFGRVLTSMENMRALEKKEREKQEKNRQKEQRKREMEKKRQEKAKVAAEKKRKTLAKKIEKEKSLKSCLQMQNKSEAGIKKKPVRPTKTHKEDTLPSFTEAEIKRFK